MILVHRLTQVAAHLAAVARERWALSSGAAPVGEEGRRRLIALGASEAAIDRYAAAHPADRAAATRLAAATRRAGGSPDEEFAALFHDLAKGQCGLVARVLHVLEGAPTSGTPHGPLHSERAYLRVHAARVVELAREVGATERCVQILANLAALEAGEAVRADTAAVRLLALDSGLCA